MDRKSILMAAWRLNRGIPLFIVGLLLLNVMVYLLQAYAFAPQLDRLQRELIERQTFVRDARLGGVRGDAPAAVYRRGKEDLEKFSAALPDKSELSALVGEIFSLAGKAGLPIDSIGYDPKEVPGQGVLRYGLGFSVRGDYGRIKRFIHLLEQSDRLIVIDDIALRGGRETGKGSVDLRLKLATFFRTEAS